MTDKKTVDPQITDAVTQANVKVLAEAPAAAIGNLYQSMSQSTGAMFENAVNAQNQANILAQASNTHSIMGLSSGDTSSTLASVAAELAKSNKDGA